jgi:hypothetical protein
MMTECNDALSFSRKAGEGERAWPACGKETIMIDFAIDLVVDLIWAAGESLFGGWRSKGKEPRGEIAGPTKWGDATTTRRTRRQRRGRDSIDRDNPNA